MNELTIKKIKVVNKDKKIKLDYLINGDEMSGTFVEPAAPEFYDTMKRLTSPVCEIIEVPEDMFEGRLEPFGVTYFHGQNCTSASIQCRLHMNDSDTDTVLNTPVRKISTEYDDGLEGPTCALLSQLEEEAKKYLTGQRAQTNLFEDAQPGLTVVK